MTTSDNRRRRAIGLGLVGALAGAALLVPATAQAAPGDGPGGLTLSPTSGSTLDHPLGGFTAANACPADHRGAYVITVNQSDGTQVDFLSPIVEPAPDSAPSAPFSDVSLDQMLVKTHGLPSGDYEIALNCYNAAEDDAVIADDVWITVNLEAQTWQVRTAGSSPVATTTSLTATPNPAGQGDEVTLRADVVAASGDPAGSVEFFNGATSLGTAVVSGGSASKVVSDLPVGANPVKAVFTPSDAMAFGASTSAPVSVTINGAGQQQGQETINVDIPSSGSDGAFALTVSPDAVDMATATSDGTNFNSTGTLSAVTVSDGRTVSKPGWSITGTVGDFVSGANTIPGDDLGWAPLIKSPNSANDVTAGDKITPGSALGLKEGAELASAAAGHGLGDTTLGGNLTLKASAADTAPGTYLTTLTLTAVTTATG